MTQIKVLPPVIYFLDSLPREVNQEVHLNEFHDNEGELISNILNPVCRAVVTLLVAGKEPVYQVDCNLIGLGASSTKIRTEMAVATYLNMQFHIALQHYHDTQTDRAEQNGH